MAPTLQDVSLLLGLPLAGHAIGPLDVPSDWQLGIAQRFAGIHDRAPVVTSDNHGPKYEWLLHFQVSSPAA